MKNVSVLIIFIAASLSFTACKSKLPLTYLDGQFDTAALSQIKVPEPVIQKGDLISIVVYSDNPQATALYNQPVVGVSNTATTFSDASNFSNGRSSTAGYLVDNDGDISFQGLGILHIEGLTKEQLIDMLDSKLKDTLLSNPYYDIRFLNYKVTVLGDVIRPGVYSIPTERLTILEALGLAGDMTLYGKRNDVLVVREVNGTREFGRIDLTKPEALNSKYFYLLQNDMVIVNADKRKISATDQSTVRNVSIVTSIVSAVGIIISILTR